MSISAVAVSAFDGVVLLDNELQRTLK